MSQKIAPEEAMLEAAAKLAKAEGELGITPEAAERVYAKVQASLQKPEPRRLPWALALAPLAALAALWWWRAPAPAPPESPEAIASLRYLSGRADWDPAVPLSEVELAASERLELSLPGAKAVLYGPLSASFTHNTVLLRFGRGVFSVVPRSESQAPFAVRAPDGQVVVHGTVFDVTVADARLGLVSVEHGQVEVQRGPERVMLGDQQRSERGAERQDQPVRLEDQFEAPWWSGDGAPGYLELDSSPAGAEVTLDEQPVGRTPLLVAWPAGAHRLKLSLAGHESVEDSLQLDAGARLKRVIKLTPIVATAEPQEEPAEASAPRGSGSWSKARRLLEAKRCRALERELSLLEHDARSDRRQAEAELLGAECLLRQRRFEQAYLRFARLAERFPATSSGESAQFEAAKLAEDLGRRALALDALGEYLARHPEGRFVEAARLRRCELLVRLNRLSEAEACLEDFRTQHPAAIRSNAAVLLAGDLARVRGQAAEAVANYRRYLSQAPDGASAELAHYYLCQGLVKLNDPDARATMAAFLKAFPESPRADDIRRWYAGAR